MPSLTRPVSLPAAYTWFDRLLALPGRLAALFHRPKSVKRSVRLALEAVEDRLVPTGTIVAGMDWDPELTGTSVEGQAVELDVTLEGIGGGEGGTDINPTGTVTFYAAYAAAPPTETTYYTLGIVSLSPISTSASHAHLVTTGLRAGMNFLEATYSGDDTFEGNSVTDEEHSVIAATGQPNPLVNSGNSCPSGGAPDNTVTTQTAPPAKPPATGQPVRYVDGSNIISATDIESDGFGGSWGQARSWSNDPTYSAGSAMGNGWVAAQQPRLSQSGSSLILVTNAATARYYDGLGTPDANGNYATYAPRFTDTQGVAYDAATDEFVVPDGAGGVLRFFGFGTSRPAAQRGSLASWTAADGAVTAVSTDTDGRMTEVQRSAVENGVTVTESYLYGYIATGSNAGLLGSVTLRRQTGGGAWITVREVDYTYYDGTTDNGNLGDLERAVVKDGDGTVLGESYYRYYTSDVFTGGVQTGYQGGMKYALGQTAYARLAAAAGGDAAVDAAADSAVSGYADNYFEYDDAHRVTKEVAAGEGCSVCSAGQGTYTFAYTVSANLDGFNSWHTKTVVTLPTGAVDTVYTNAYGEVMLSALQAPGGPTDVTYDRYAETGSGLGGGQLVLDAAPSAVSGYDDTYADLVNYVAGNAQYLRDSDGLVTVYTYGTSTTATSSAAGDAAGYLKETDLRHGETGTAVPQQALTYLERTAYGVDSFVPASSTVYRNTDGTGGETTSLNYTWQGSTAQPASVTTTLPAVTTGENGLGSATSMTTVYDSLGRVEWTKDAAGFLTYTAYDLATGAVVKTIQDVDTDDTGDFADLPTGWTTPTGGGLELITTYEVDSIGRPTKETDPDGNVTYAVYDDPDHEVRTYAGWNSSTGTPTGPTQVYREDWADGYVETLTMSAAPHLTGGVPDGTEAISGLQSLSRSYLNAAGQTVEEDDYFDLSGLTYSTGTMGTAGVNYYETLYAYGDGGLPDRTVSPQGTIYRTVYDALGRPVSDWVGTDDTPTTGYWSPTNLAGTDMVEVASYVYDGGEVGDGNLTEMTQYPGGGADNRVSDYWYDWRDRQVAEKDGVQTTETTVISRPLFYTDYDNLDEPVMTRQYLGDGVTLTDANGDGVPDAPPSSLLRAETATSYDELGQVYRVATYSVNPSTGAVSTNSLRTDTWYDARGNVIKTAEPGGLVTKYAYDGAGRVTTVYATDGGGDTGYADAGNVTGDTVLEQTEYTYDKDGNVIETADRQRFHDASGTGALGDPSSGIGARVYYSGSYYDAAGRDVADVDVGTNGGTTWTRPGTIPSRSDTVLVTSYTYDGAGNVLDVTDPKGIVTRTYYDALGRTTKTIEDYTDGVPTSDTNKTTEYTYNGVGMTSLTAVNPDGVDQTTAWVYGVTQPASGITSNDIVGATEYPDPATGAASSSQEDTVTVNALGETVTATDRNGTTHTYTYDVIGRLTVDAVTALGSGVDGSVRRVETAYGGLGQPYQITSYNAVSGGSIVTQVLRDFNGLGQLTTEWQSHSGAVSFSTTPKVQYAYNFNTGGTVNQSRLVSETYPSGYALTYTYASGVDSAISRLSSLSDSAGAVEGYQYLGLGTVVNRAHPATGLTRTYVSQTGGTGDAGDEYTGLDRFGRVVDQLWYVLAPGVPSVAVTTDEFQYTYDRDGNALTRDNGIDSAFDETYTYDSLNQLTTFARGTHTTDWDYDGLGNFAGVDVDGTTQTRTANAQNQITGIDGATTPTYDAAGEMTGDETGKTFVYDAWGELVAVKDSGGATLETFKYDGRGYRVANTVGGTTTDLYYSAGQQVLEEKQGSNTTQRYVWSPVYVNAVVLRDRDTDANGTLDERLWATQDANYNVTALVDGTGAVVERDVYEPFGQQTVYSPDYSTVRSSSLYGWVVGFQGLRYDPTSGLDFTFTRPYSPTLGRPVETDPTGLAPDTNDYRWEGNGPTNWTDPSGLDKAKRQGNNLYFERYYYITPWKNGGEYFVGPIVNDRGTEYVKIGQYYVPLDIVINAIESEGVGGPWRSSPNNIWAWFKDHHVADRTPAAGVMAGRAGAITPEAGVDSTFMGFQGTNRVDAVRGLGRETASAAKDSYVKGPLLVAGAAIAVAGLRMMVVFGNNNPNGIHHAFRHTDQAGIDRVALQAAINDDLSKVANATTGQLIIRDVTVAGKTVTYNAMPLANGSINVGRITVKCP